ncbi:MAG: SCP2 sterol-binding domain-containing protein [Desulfuromonadales bacterium]|nr:SCP2 sterol-binding domain-containing protein [Desulfuromonadales bacterium]
MPDIFTNEWYQAMIDLCNSRDDLSAKVPKGEYKFAIELVGDGKSPYVPEGTTKHFFLIFKDGKVTQCEESPEKISGKGLNYRITGAAEDFELIATGDKDPVDAGLSGQLNVRGDMRFLMQNAEMATVIFEVYQQSKMTTWPQGKPPYDNTKQFAV